MMESEKKIFEMMNKKAAMSKYWMPLVWATNIINRARKEQLITSDHVVQTLLVELSDIRKKLGGLIGYDTVCVPLVYTQVDYSSLSHAYKYPLGPLLRSCFIRRVPDRSPPLNSLHRGPEPCPTFASAKLISAACPIINPFTPHY
jgi:hypothetical protein